MPNRTTPPGRASHEDILDRMSRGDKEFQDINVRLGVILHQLKGLDELKADVQKVKEDVAEVSGEVAATKELVEAWATVKTLSRFVKWASGLVVALVGIVVALKSGAIQLLGK